MIWNINSGQTKRRLIFQVNSKFLPFVLLYKKNPNSVSCQQGGISFRFNQCICLHFCFKTNQMARNLSTQEFYIKQIGGLQYASLTFECSYFKENVINQRSTIAIWGQIPLEEHTWLFCRKVENPLAGFLLSVPLICLI